MSLLDFKLRDGTDVQMLAFWQQRTYGSVLIGGPQKRLNDVLLSRAERSAKQALGDLPVFVLPPTISIEPDGAEALPPVHCAAEFQFFTFTDGLVHQLIVVWFEQHPDPRVSEGTIARLQDIDMLALAKAWPIGDW